jgi:hypothetical protein
MLDSKGKDALKRIVMFRNVFVAEIRANVGSAAGRGCGKVGRPPSRQIESG